jgi:hypothetical protein
MTEVLTPGTSDVVAAVREVALAQIAPAALG